MKIVKSVLLCATVLLFSTPVLANQAKFNKIERQYKACMNKAYTAGLYQQCSYDAVIGYSKLFNKSQRALYNKRTKACMKFGNPLSGDFNASLADQRNALDCMHEKAKAIAKRK